MQQGRGGRGEWLGDWVRGAIGELLRRETRSSAFTGDASWEGIGEVGEGVHAGKCKNPDRRAGRGTFIVMATIVITNCGVDRK